MQLDRKTLDRLLALNDRQLQAVIDKLVTDFGLDLSKFRVKEGDMEALRRAIRGASDEELLSLGEQFRRGGK